MQSKIFIFPKLLSLRCIYKIIYNYTNMFLRFVLLFIFITSCALSPGFKKEPTSKNPKRMGLKQNGVSLTFYNLNKMNASSLPRIKDIKKKRKKK